MSKNRDDVIRELQYETSRLAGEYVLALSDGNKKKAEQLKREFEQAKEQLRRLEQNKPPEETIKLLSGSASKKLPEAPPKPLIESTPKSAPKKAPTKLRGPSQPKKRKSNKKAPKDNKPINTKPFPKEASPELIESRYFMGSRKKKDRGLSSNSKQTITSTSENGKKEFESLGPLPMVDLGAPDGPQRLQRIMTRRLAKGLIRRGICPHLRRPWPPELADMEALYHPPMVDGKLEDGRTLKEAWPELKAQIMALPDE